MNPLGSVRQRLRSGMVLTTFAGVLVLAALLGAIALRTGADRQQAEQALSDAIMAESRRVSGFTKDDADCFAAGLVSRLGVDGLKEIDLLDDDLRVITSPSRLALDRTRAQQAAQAYVKCVYPDALYGDKKAELKPVVRKCLDRELNRRVFTRVMTARFMGDATATSILIDRTASCALKGTNQGS